MASVLNANFSRPHEMTAELEQLRYLVFEGMAGKAPRVNATNNHWEVYDVETAQWVDTGYVAVGRDGADGRDGANGADGIDGKSLRVNTDGHITYWDDENHQWVDTGIEAEGAPGPDGAAGADGYSPAVTISSITGGHRITITDKAHPNGQSFDVMDGDSSGARLLYYFPNSGVMQCYEHPGDESLQEITGEGVSDLVLVDGFAVFVYEPGIQRVYQLTQLPDNNGRLAIFISEGDPKLKLTMPWQNSSVTKTDITEQAQVRYFRHYTEASGVFAAHEIAYEDGGSVIAADGEDIANVIVAGVQVEILDYPLGNSRTYKPEFILGGTQVQFRSTDMNGNVSGLVVPWESSIAVPFTAIGDMPTPDVQTDVGKVPTVNSSGGYSLQTPSGEGSGVLNIGVTRSGSEGAFVYTADKTADEIMAHRENLVVTYGPLQFTYDGYISSGIVGGYFYFSIRELENNAERSSSFVIYADTLNDTVEITYTSGLELKGLPTVTSADNGKVLGVVNGAWSKMELTDGDEVSY